MKRRVLLGFADALAAIESAWSLLGHGFEVYAFSRAGTRPAAGRDRDVRVVEITPPERDANRAAADLNRLVGDLRPAAVLPLDDHAIWLSGRAERSWSTGPAGPGPGSSRPDSPGPAAPGTVLAGPSGYLAELALDKRLQLKAAASAGFSVPDSFDAVSEPLTGAGPWMVKPVLAVEFAGGRLRRPTGRVAGTPDQVREAAAALGGPAIAQPLIEGAGEGVFGLATADGVTALSAHQRIRMMNPRGSGSSACRSIPVAESLRAPVRDFIAATSWRGLFMIELLRDRDGTPWFMELNGRPWGSMTLARRRGFEYPAWAVQAALDEGFSPRAPAAAPHLTARHLGREIVHLGMVMARGGAPRLGTVRDVLTVRRGERWYNWRRGHAAVFAADTWDTVSAKIPKRSRPNT